MGPSAQAGRLVSHRSTDSSIVQIADGGLAKFSSPCFYLSEQSRRCHSVRVGLVEV